MTKHLSRWMRRHTPWWLLSFVNRHTHTCWIRMCAWKYDWEWDEGIISWCPKPSCWDGPGEGYDYCGRWQRREDMKLDQSSVGTAR